MLADKVKQLREELGITQAELAEASGLTQAYISELETGKKGASVGTIKRIAKALNTSVAMLIDEGAQTA